jgi:hypothetical protein
MVKGNLWVADPRVSRHSRESGNPGLEWNRALGARYSKANCGWLRPCTLGDFSLLVQREVTKRKHARVAHRPNTGRCPALLAKPGARQLVGRIKRGSTRTGARLKTPGFAAVLGSRHGIFNPPQTLVRSIFKPLKALIWIPASAGMTA